MDMRRIQKKIMKWEVGRCTRGVSSAPVFVLCLGKYMRGAARCIMIYLHKFSNYSGVIRRYKLAATTERNRAKRRKTHKCHHLYFSGGHLQLPVSYLYAVFSFQPQNSVCSISCLRTASPVSHSHQPRISVNKQMILLESEPRAGVGPAVNHDKGRKLILRSVSQPLKHCPGVGGVSSPYLSRYLDTVFCYCLKGWAPGNKRNSSEGCVRRGIDLQGFDWMGVS